MPYLTVVDNIPIEDFDYILIDESQDSNKTNIELIKRLSDNSEMTICVGDRNQSIMGFRGSENDAMDQLVRETSSVELPLSLCYRNSKAVCRLVNETFPDIIHEVPDTAIEGEVLTIEGRDLQACVKPGDMVICRTNAPLVKPCFELIRKGVKAVIMGRSIGDELVNLINRVSKRVTTDNLEFILANLSEYKNVETMRLMAQGKESTAQALEDKVDTIFALAEGCKVLSELIDKAETIFSDDAKGVVFSSAHRAKGLESDHVFILRYDLMPHPMANKDWQIKQEMNCKFVALTRSKNKLFFVQENK
jgi:superfamily I DNA/RNA helicase